MRVTDPRNCTGCGASLGDCYDRPRYKGTLACCVNCDHPTLAQIAQARDGSHCVQAFALEYGQMVELVSDAPLTGVRLNVLMPPIRNFERLTLPRPSEEAELRRREWQEALALSIISGG
jgi:hypothetical protein